MTSTLSSNEAAAAVRLINAAPREFGRDFNKLPFHFSHNLAGNPLFRLERLSQLAEKLLTDKSSRSLR